MLKGNSNSKNSILLLIPGVILIIVSAYLLIWRFNPHSSYILINWLSLFEEFVMLCAGVGIILYTSLDKKIAKLFYIVAAIFYIIAAMSFAAQNLKVLDNILMLHAFLHFLSLAAVFLLFYLVNTNRTPFISLYAALLVYLIIWAAYFINLVQMFSLSGFGVYSFFATFQDPLIGISLLIFTLYLHINRAKT